ncbi:MAG TPA: thioesterase domain-containing protein, partial [Blastocatellia bacterium]
EMRKKIPLATLFEEATIEHLAAVMLKRETITPQSAIVEIQKGDSKRPFFFLHGDYNGGGFYCLNLARGLRADQSFYAVQPHGLDGEPIPASIEAMARSRLQALRAFQPLGPYLLGGYCNGGLVAFEMARQLESQGEKVDLLVLLCASATNARFKLLQSLVNLTTRPEARLTRFLSLRERIARVERISNYYGGRFNELWRMKRDERISFFRKRAGKIVTNLAVAFRSALSVGKSISTPTDIYQTTQADEDRHSRMTAIYDRAVMGYVPKRYAGRVIILWPDEMALDDTDDPSDGWSRVAAEVEVRQVRGGHVTCLTQHVADLAAALRSCLEKAQADARAENHYD